MQTNTPSKFTLADGAGHTFFNGDVVPIQEAPDRARGEACSVLVPKQVRQLDQRDIHLCVDRAEDHVSEHLDAMRTLVATLSACPR